MRAVSLRASEGQTGARGQPRLSSVHLTKASIRCYHAQVQGQRVLVVYTPPSYRSCLLGLANSNYYWNNLCVLVSVEDVLITRQQDTLSHTRQSLGASLHMLFYILYISLSLSVYIILCSTHLCNASKAMVEKWG